MFNGDATWERAQETKEQKRISIEQLIPMVGYYQVTGMMESVRLWVCAHPSLSTLAAYESHADACEWPSSVVEAVRKEIPVQSLPCIGDGSNTSRRSAFEREHKSLGYLQH